jgi:3-phenylpropionate/trans-cinnamate dioxygenase ferredoxin reductase component
MRTVAVVGSSLAGYSAAVALRANGFDGRLEMIGAERRLPYDRPPLSKEFLTGTPSVDSLALGDAEDIDALAAHWWLGRVATKLDTRRGGVWLADGTLVKADGVVIATGASPKMLPGAHSAAGVHLLRTVDDAEALRADLRIGSPRVAVVGGGFIGAEVASAAASIGLDVTVIEAAEVPLAAVLGERLGRLCTNLHSDNGVLVLTGTGVAGLSTRDGRVSGVELADGRHVPAEVVVIGIGVRPNTDWLAGSKIPVLDGVLCDVGCVTRNPSVVAVGDVARVRQPGQEHGVRSEHWTAASAQPGAAVRNLLAGRTVADATSVPYFWSDQYGVRIQFAGEAHPEDEVVIVEGSEEDRCLVANYVRAGHVVGVLSLNQPRAFARAKRGLATPELASAG